MWCYSSSGANGSVRVFLIYYSFYKSLPSCLALSKAALHRFFSEIVFFWRTWENLYKWALSEQGGKQIRCSIPWVSASAEAFPGAQSAALCISLSRTAFPCKQAVRSPMNDIRRKNYPDLSEGAASKDAPLMICLLERASWDGCTESVFPIFHTVLSFCTSTP